MEAYTFWGRRSHTNLDTVLYFFSFYFLCNFFPSVLSKLSSKLCEISHSAIDCAVGNNKISPCLHLAQNGKRGAKMALGKSNLGSKMLPEVGCGSRQTDGCLREKVTTSTHS